jgi:hypothetical protein
VGFRLSGELRGGQKGWEPWQEIIRLMPLLPPHPNPLPPKRGERGLKDHRLEACATVDQGVISGDPPGRPYGRRPSRAWAKIWVPKQELENEEKKVGATRWVALFIGAGWKACATK